MRLLYSAARIPHPLLTIYPLRAKNFLFASVRVYIVDVYTYMKRNYFYYLIVNSSNTLFFFFTICMQRGCQPYDLLGRIHNDMYSIPGIYRKHVHKRRIPLSLISYIAATQYNLDNLTLSTIG